MTCGVYKIENLINGKVYVGQSVDIEARWCAHRSVAAKLDHPLYRAIRKYGLENFSFSILEEVSPARLTEAEDRHLKHFKGSTKVYNIAPAAGSTLGFRHSQETRAKLSAARKGVPLSPEIRAKLSEAKKASEATAAHCRKMAEAKKGVPHSVEHRGKIGAKSRGRVTSEETKAKLRAARLGRKLSPEHKAKISASLLGNQRTAGRKLSEEHKAKVSASLVGNTRSLGIKHTPESQAAMSEGQRRRWAALAAQKKQTPLTGAEINGVSA